MNGNGIGGAGAVPIITPNAKFEFTEMQFRMIHAQVKKFVGANGGQIPISDPLAVLTMGLILDKMAEIEAKLTTMSGPIVTNPIPFEAE